MTMTDAQLRKLTSDLTASVPGAVAAGIRDHLAGLSLRVESGARTPDAWRPLIHFLAGLLAASLALMIALFSAFQTGGGETGLVVNRLVAASLAAVLASSVLTTGCIAAAQWAKAHEVKAGAGALRRWLFALACAGALLAMAFMAWEAWRLARAFGEWGGGGVPLAQAGG